MATANFAQERLDFTEVRRRLRAISLVVYLMRDTKKASAIGRHE